MRIGNDVVDLSDPETLEQELHPRFDERVFSAIEAEIIRSSPQPHRTRWTYWSAKESAYKVAKKLDPTTVFSPIRFEVKFDRKDAGIVVHDTKRFYVQTNHAQRYVHAVAFSIPTGLRDSGLLRIPFPRRFDPSRTRFANEDRREFLLYGHVRANRTIKNRPDKLSLFTRRQATLVIGSLLGIQPDRIEIPNHTRIPRARSEGYDLPVDLSLSHHGRYVAYAIYYLMPTSSTSKTSMP